MARVPSVLCAGKCGRLLWGGSSSLPAGQATCRDCRRATWSHGTTKGYRDNNCRCNECTEWNRLSHQQYVDRRNAGAYELKPCAETDCDKPAWARSLCKMHYRRVLRLEGRDQSPSNAWSDTRRSNSHARRARIKGSRSSDKVLISALLARDGNTCPACLEPIDMTLAYPHEYSRSIDHTHPLSKGGTHTLDNTTLMHLVCNLRKGASTQEVQHGTQRATQHHQAQQVQVSSSSR